MLVEVAATRKFTTEKRTSVTVRRRRSYIMYTKGHADIGFHIGLMAGMTAKGYTGWMVAKASGVIKTSGTDGPASLLVGRNRTMKRAGDTESAMLIPHARLATTDRAGEPVGPIQVIIVLTPLLMIIGTSMK